MSETTTSSPEQKKPQVLDVKNMTDDQLSILTDAYSLSEGLDNRMMHVRDMISNSDIDVFDKPELFRVNNLELRTAAKDASNEITARAQEAKAHERSTEINHLRSVLDDTEGYKQVYNLSESDVKDLVADTRAKLSELSGDKGASAVKKSTSTQELRRMIQEANEGLAGFEPDVKTKSKLESKARPTGDAVWQNAEHDEPVKVTGYVETDDGREYVTIEGSKTGIPLDEIRFSDETSVEDQIKARGWGQAPDAPVSSDSDPAPRWERKIDEPVPAEGRKIEHWTDKAFEPVSLVDGSRLDAAGAFEPVPLVDGSRLDAIDTNGKAQQGAPESLDPVQPVKMPDALADDGKDDGEKSDTKNAEDESDNEEQEQKSRFRRWRDNVSLAGIAARAQAALYAIGRELKSGGIQTAENASETKESRKRKVGRWVLGGAAVAAAGVVTYLAGKNSGIFNSFDIASAAPDLTPSPSAAGKAAEKAAKAKEAIDDFAKYDTPSHWAREQFGPEYMDDLHRLSNQAEAAGNNVEWHGSGNRQWVEVNGKSDTPSVLKVFSKFNKK